MTAGTLTPRALNRALLARQWLLGRSTGTMADVVEQVAGLQTQYAPSGYVGLWTRMAGFQRDSLTRALEEGSLVQATLMRNTIHIVSRGEFWRYAMGVRQARREWFLKATGNDEQRLRASAAEVREALAEGPKTVKELGELGKGFVGNRGLFVDLVRIPPSGTWERRRADRLELAERWIGPCDATEAEGRAHLVRAYLRAFGPAAWKDVASWSGLSMTAVKTAARDVHLVRYLDSDGRELIDLPDAPLPDPETPAPVRFLPHWDANLLVHARRTGLLPEPYRPRVFSVKNPFSVGTFLVDGAVAGAWSVRNGRVELDPYSELSTRDRDAVEAERAALEAFHA